MAFSNDPQAYWWLDLNIVESIRSTNATAGNVIVVDILDVVKDAVQRGEQMWVTHAKHPLVVPPLASQKVSSARRPASASAGLLVDVGESFGAMLTFSGSQVSVAMRRVAGGCQVGGTLWDHCFAAEGDRGRPYRVSLDGGVPAMALQHAHYVGVDESTGLLELLRITGELTISDAVVPVLAGGTALGAGAVVATAASMGTFFSMIGLATGAVPRVVDRAYCGDGSSCRLRDRVSVSEFYPVGAQFDVDRMGPRQCVGGDCGWVNLHFRGEEDRADYTDTYIWVRLTNDLGACV